MSKTRTCAHIKVSGVRCGSPALRGQDYCYFHYRMLCTSRISHVALLEDGEAIQVSIMEVVNSLLRGTMDVKRGELVLRALNTAVRNSRNAHFATQWNMVTSLPKDPVVQPRPDAPTKEEIAAFEKETLAQYHGTNLGEKTAESSADAQPTNAAFAGDKEGTSGDGRPARPSGPDVSVRSVDPAERKPPIGEKKAAAPQERKSAAHGASRG